MKRPRINSLGVEFGYYGDWVIWLWPWKRNGLPKYISIGFSGTGEFGDARYNTLEEIQDAWKEYFLADSVAVSKTGPLIEF